MTIGKLHRLNKILNYGKSVLILPIDHGLTSGPVVGLEEVSMLKRWINTPYISSIIAHKGMIERIITNQVLKTSKSLILHLNGNSSLDEDPYKKHLLTTVESAVHLGCDAVSIDLNFYPKTIGWNYQQLGQVADNARQCGLPVLVMISEKQQGLSDEVFVQNLRRYIRGSYELGADIIKISIPLDKPSLYYETLFSGLSQDIPLLIAGGGKMSDNDFFEKMKNLMSYKIGGFCIGRNIFQASNPTAFIDKFIRSVYAEESLYA